VTTGFGALWCHEMRVSFGAVGGALSWVLALSRDTGDFRGDDLGGVCEVTAG